MPNGLHRLLLGCLVLWAGLTGLPGPSAQASPTLDSVPRVAILSAFPQEMALLLGKLEQTQQHRVNGVTFSTGVLLGKPVVLFLSGISMTNTAMNTQLALDRFKITHLVFSGIAGGVNPALNIGDVVVAQRWGQYLEVLMARETAPGKFAQPLWMDDAKLPNFGMLHPRPIAVRSAGHSGEEKKFWFDADPQLLSIARGIQGTALADCDVAKKCLTLKPKLVIGGNGVSGQAFVDNAAFREYTFRTFDANVLDMETAATAMVAYSNGVPYIAFRSLSDLAGGGGGENEISTFMNIAAENAEKVLLAFLAAWK
ncbi:MAG: 5'-methylthioadenosine/S-adenosylhomocysteine nucleosidase [Rhodoferax sp.]